MKITYGSVKKVSGWLGYVDYEIFKLLNSSCLSNTNSALEIGVHHGKSALAISCFSETRKLYAIDVFGDQGKNIDGSGSGDRKVFLDNMKKFGIAHERIFIDQRMSNEVSPEDVLDAVGLISFFHIDGGHHRDAVASDTKLACAVASDDCVIAIDDMFRPEWPEVSSAAFSTKYLDDNNFILFAIGFNKGYWCKKEYIEEKQRLLIESKNLSPHLHKIYSVENRKILIFQRYPLPEWGMITVLFWYFEIYHPLIYRPLEMIHQKLRKTAKKFLG